MVIPLALGAAVLIGSADVFGSLAARKGRVLACTLWVILVSVLPVVAIAYGFGGEAQTRDYVYGGVAGVGGAIGLLALYAGYSRAAVGIVGPVTAVVSVVLPVTVGISIGDSVGPLALVGIVVGAVAIALVGWRPDTGARASRSTAVGFGIGSGLAFGVMATFLGLTNEAAEIVPLVMTRTVSAATLILVGLAARLPLLPMPGSWKHIVIATVGATGGLIMFTLAAQENLTIAGLLLQMAYGVSALLAVVFFSERPTRSQQLGFAAAAASIALISFG